jgi:hypothetical protein
MTCNPMCIQSVFSVFQGVWAYTNVLSGFYLLVYGWNYDVHLCQRVMYNGCILYRYYDYLKVIYIK